MMASSVSVSIATSPLYPATTQSPESPAAHLALSIDDGTPLFEAPLPIRQPDPATGKQKARPLGAGHDGQCSITALDQPFA
jgi:hypothetical protein